jgi:hypothetical protein
MLVKSSPPPLLDLNEGESDVLRRNQTSNIYYQYNKKRRIVAPKDPSGDIEGYDDYEEEE